MKNLLYSIIIISISVIGCDESASPFAYDKQIVVTGLIEAGRSVDTVKLVYTGEVDKVYNPSSYAITNAVVRIIGTDVAFIDTLVHDPINPGRYYSKDTTKVIQATKTYSLDIKTADGKSVTAIATVPDTFSMIFATVINNSVIRYNTENPVNFFAWTPSRLHGTYLPTVTSVDSAAARIPKSFIRDTTGFPPPDKIGYRIGLPKEQTYTELPWIFLGYFGTTRFDIYAVDENYTQFLNQFAAAQGGELREIRYSIRGGLGVFGARTKAKGSITVYITP
ncbi:MAG: DUF4249 family protein [Bacteroidota bacterium]